MENAKNTLLIVDDEPLNIAVLVGILKDEYRIYVAKSGADAVESAHEFLPDTILLDVVMPDMDGYEVLEKLKQSDTTRDIPVIFVTGLEGGDSERRGLTLGAADYISRSMNETVIKLRVRHHIQLANQLRTIESLNKNLEAALETAESASRAKSNFLAKMSHEIRTPMNAILGITEILLQDEQMPQSAMEGIHRIHSSGDLLLRIINDILDLTKIESGGMELILQEYEVAELISATISINKMHFNSKDVEFHLRVEEDVPAVVVGDLLRVKQILNNLISNASKYTDEGRVILSVSVDGSNLVFDVSDTGMGMSAEQVGRLFDEYSRFHEASNRFIQGAGLGMSITRNLVTIMNGEITVDSEVNKGTRVIVSIPQEIVGTEVIGRDAAENLRHFRKASMAQDVLIAQNSMSNSSVLVVDDMDSNLYVAKGLLVPYGLNIVTASSGFDAIKLVEDGNTYDIIFMDHMMPDMDGIETVENLRKIGYSHPIVALTANALVGQSEMFLSSGFDGFISKPIDMREMDLLLKKFIVDVLPVKEPEKMDEDEAILLQVILQDVEKALVGMEILINKPDSYTEKDVHAYTINVHAMKSVMGHFGREDLSQQAVILERAVLDNDMDFVFAESAVFLDAMREIIHQHISESGDSGGDDIAYLREQLFFIQKFCESKNPGAAEKILKELRLMPWSTHVKDVLAALNMQFLTGNYEKIIQTVKEFVAE